ncbi:hypothetical protein DU490_01285 [Halomonas sp. DQ26W]|nr:hypothetical protein DU490_01285 [Halomonas sp. DQ26W]
MKFIFALALGTIALLLAVTTQDSTSVRILLASVGLALCAVALSPGAARGKPIASWHLKKPGKPKLAEFSDRPQVSLAEQAPLTQSILTSSPGGKHSEPPLDYRSLMQPHNAAGPKAPNSPAPQRVR